MGNERDDRDEPRVVSIGGRPGSVAACLKCSMKAGILNGLVLADLGPLRTCKRCGERTIELQGRDLEEANAWFVHVWQAGHHASTKARATAQGMAAQAAGVRLGAAVGIIREQGMEPEPRAAVDLTRLMWDLEDGLLEEAERGRRK